MEMMSDSIDDTLDDDEAEEETEELTNQVLPYYHMPVAVIRRSKQMLWMMTYGSEQQLLLNIKLPSCSPRTFCWYLLAGPIYPYVPQSSGILPFWFKLMHPVAVSCNLGFFCTAGAWWDWSRCCNSGNIFYISKPMFPLLWVYCWNLSYL